MCVPEKLFSRRSGRRGRGGLDEFLRRGLVLSALDVVFGLKRGQRAAGAAALDPLVVLGLADNAEVFGPAERLVWAAWGINPEEDEFFRRVPRRGACQRHHQPAANLKSG